MNSYLSPSKVVILLSTWIKVYTHVSICIPNMCVLHDFGICHHFPKQAFTLIWIYVLNKITVGDPFNRNQNPCSNSPTKTLHNNESYFTQQIM